MRMLYLAAIIAALASCRSTKSLQTAISKKDSLKNGSGNASRLDSMNFISTVYGNIAKNRITAESFSAKIKVDFVGSDGKRNDFTANLRMQSDSVIWVSINAVLGIEAFRVLITPDSVKVMNKLDKVVQLRSVSYLKEIAKIPFGFNEVQNLLLGNPIYFDSTIVSYRREGDLISVLHIGNLFRHLLTVGGTDYLVQHSKLDDVNPVRGRSANINYGEYENRNDMQFSTYRRITVSDKSKLDIEMKYRQYEFNVPLNFPFNIPKNYKLQ